MEAVTALSSLARGMLDGITCRIELTIGKGLPFIYLPSRVPTKKEGGQSKECTLLIIMSAPHAV